MKKNKNLDEENIFVSVKNTGMKEIKVTTVKYGKKTKEVFSKTGNIDENVHLR